jgi:hypothetical protein
MAQAWQGPMRPAAQGATFHCATSGPTPPNHGRAAMLHPPLPRPQRLGRAGRVRPGKCLCLYTRERFDHHMRRYGVPEISRVPLEELLLQVRAWGRRGRRGRKRYRAAAPLHSLHFQFVSP